MKDRNCCCPSGGPRAEGQGLAMSDDLFEDLVHQIAHAAGSADGVLDWTILGEEIELEFRGGRVRVSFARRSLS